MEDVQNRPDSRLIPKILRSITDNPTGRPVIAQMIGNDIPALVRTAKELQQFPIAAVKIGTLSEIISQCVFNRLVVGDHCKL